MKLQYLFVFYLFDYVTTYLYILNFIKLNYLKVDLIINLNI